MRVYIERVEEKDLNLEGRAFSKMVKDALKVTQNHLNSDKLDQTNVIYHLLSLADESKAIEGHNRKLPVFINALYCESDPCFRLLDDEKKMTRWLRFLNEATTVLVPNEEAKRLLSEWGIKGEIQVLKPPIEKERFLLKREKDVFYHYFKEEENRPLVVALGDLSSLEGRSIITQLAKQYPHFLFYYFDLHPPLHHSVTIEQEQDIKNLKYVSHISDDLFISALMNAKLFIAPSYTPLSPLTLSKVMASECQIIMRSQANTIGFIKDGVNGYVSQYRETLLSLCQDYLEGKLASTIKGGKAQIQEASYDHYGYRLDELYLEAKNKSS